LTKCKKTIARNSTFHLPLFRLSYPDERVRESVPLVRITDTVRARQSGKRSIRSAHFFRVAICGAQRARCVILLEAERANHFLLRLSRSCGTTRKNKLGRRLHPRLIRNRSNDGRVTFSVGVTNLESRQTVIIDTGSSGSSSVGLRTLCSWMPFDIAHGTRWKCCRSCCIILLI